MTIGPSTGLFAALTLLLVLVNRVFHPAPAVRSLAFLAATVALFGIGFPSAAVVLFPLCAIGYPAIWLVGRSQTALGLGLLTAAATAAFVALMHPTGIGAVDRVLPLVGLPYVYLRVLSLGSEVRDGRTTLPGVLEYFTYILPFHQVVAGPIETFSAFRENLVRPPGPLDVAGVLTAVNRIANGLIKKLVVCELLVDLFGFEFTGSGGALALEIAANAIFFYLDFSGYMDLVIGAGQLIGWAPPENFDWPFSSRNIVEFWTRWHITLGAFIRDFLFNPLNLVLQRGPLRGRPFAAGLVCYVAAMVFCGFWHHPSVRFVEWGLYHAGGIVVFKYYELGLKRLLGVKRAQAWRERGPVRVAATGLTFAFVAVSFLFVKRSPAEILSILARLA